MKNAFSMIELIFVIVVLGILAAIAVPKFAATRTDAQIAKARATVASVRSGIVSERQTRLITGDSAYISGINLNTGTGLFGGVLMYPISTGLGDGSWSQSVADTNETSKYNYNASGVNVLFRYSRENITDAGVDYKAGTFTCDTSIAECASLVN